ncbi:MAG: DUF2267 domain-containing protein [Actinobacteria bacterium]|nr:DUF2267 domain-containing protein [Actinomycetota bacterium]
MSTYVEKVLAATPRSGGHYVVKDQVRRVREVAWGATVVILERFAGYRRGLGSRDFHIAAEVKDLVVRKSRQARGDVEALVQTVARAGSYTRDEAGRAIRAVVSGLEERVPPELLLRVAEHLSPEEAASARAVMERRAARRKAEEMSS